MLQKSSTQERNPYDRVEGEKSASAAFVVGHVQPSHGQGQLGLYDEGLCEATGAQGRATGWLATESHVEQPASRCQNAWTNGFDLLPACNGGNVLHPSALDREDEY